MTKTNTAFDAISKKPGEASSLKFRADLMFLIEDIIEQRGLSRSDVKEILGEPKTRVSELLNGKFVCFSSEKLIRYLSALGYTFNPRITKSGNVECIVEKAA